MKQSKKVQGPKPLTTPLPCKFCGKAFPTNAAFYSHTHTTGSKK
jgi:hypothetical protein